MLGLVVLLFIGLFLLVSFAMMWLAARWARKHGRRGWVWGGVAALGMYHLMFWDLIPTLLIHKYYCATEAGFWVYKTPEQWINENPGVLETLSVSHLPEEYKVKSEMLKAGGNTWYQLPDGTKLRASYFRRPYIDGVKLDHVSVDTPDGWYGNQFNERIRSLTKSAKGFPFSITRSEDKLVDLKDDAVLARYVSFSWGSSNALSLGPRGPVRALGTAYLAGGGGCNVDYQGFRNYADIFRKQGE